MLQMAGFVLHDNSKLLCFVSLLFINTVLLKLSDITLHYITLHYKCENNWTWLCGLFEDTTLAFILAVLRKILSSSQDMNLVIPEYQE